MLVLVNFEISAGSYSPYTDKTTKSKDLNVSWTENYGRIKTLIKWKHRKKRTQRRWSRRSVKNGGFFVAHSNQKIHSKAFNIASLKNYTDRSQCEEVKTLLSFLHACLVYLSWSYLWWWSYELHKKFTTLWNNFYDTNLTQIKISVQKDESHVFPTDCLKKGNFPD